MINLVFHTPTQGGTRGTPENLLDAVARIRALGEDVRINVTSMGATQLPLTTIALAMGLNVRVGMEDNVLFRRGEPLRRTTRSWSSGRCGSRTSSTGRPRRRRRRASCLALQRALADEQRGAHEVALALVRRCGPAAAPRRRP